METRLRLFLSEAEEVGDARRQTVCCKSAHYILVGCVDRIIALALDRCGDNLFSDDYYDLNVMTVPQNPL